MSDTFLLVAGVLIFSLTTMAALWFAYGVFFNLYQQDEAGLATAGSVPSERQEVTPQPAT